MSASHCMVLGNDSSRKTAFRFGVALIARHSSSVGPVSPEKAMAPPFPSMMDSSPSWRASQMNPPSMVGWPSSKKQVVLKPWSDPPWQPSTLIFTMLVPEPFLHFEEFEVFLHLAQVGHHHALGDHGDDARLGRLVDRLLHLGACEAHPPVQFVEVDRHQLALRRVLAPLARGLHEEVDHARV